MAILQYADDVLLYIRANDRATKAILKELKQFGYESGKRLIITNMFSSLVKAPQQRSGVPSSWH